MTTTPQSGRPSSAAIESSGTTPIQPVASTSQLPELPWAFIDCPTDTLVVLIAHMLDLLCQHNDQVVLTPDALTRFHSRAPPGISVIEYLRRIVKYTNLEKIPLLSLLAYIDLTCQNLPTFTLSSLTVHRFLIAGVTAGSKAQCDVFCTNAHYAKVGGIKVGELNNLEREFLRVTGWALCRYYTSLIRSHGGFVQAPEPEVSPFRAFPDAGKEAPTDSQSATPVQTTGSVLGDEPPEGAEADEDMDEEDDEMDSGSDEESPESGPTGQGAGPSRGRMPADQPADQADPAMEVDTPAAESRQEPPPSAAPAVPGSVTEASPAAPVLTDRLVAEPTQAPIPHSSTSRSLKSLMGGMFKRSSDPPPSGSAPSGLGGPASSSPKVLSGSPKPIVRSKPLASPRLNGTPSENGSKPVTPRVRTREERSVDSLRGGMPAAAPVGVDDSKTRARYE
ncbi:hypothetical protein A1Q1_04721 [Trichosporon asahii var. asahii CBS 2479]|uniref:Cyclin-domain-containing protein n=1 Tax=Trichosporon asahii var. asahii (strain ATCC 90039 / CBS 2479 / JCM 2466 / KCTC 7840 / NBRC 103889/ NCYC 2677 / UAMH 7654) TaxID=1186058 RepID=J5SP84_TRIAS|nr:hypothetical protein A1Q1_04721 [Trichosporon asahii var. asahii CBS 2479]EJT46756.1 hypothetical protein A1Q1_04721 [Trichosporon asahii var. asahii CBS 2479]